MLLPMLSGPTEFRGDCWTAGDEPAARFDMAAIAALTIVTRGGLMPHASHFGKGVYSLAVEGSKLGGTVFERPHIGHIHVAFTSLAGAGEGPTDREDTLLEPTKASLGDAYRGAGLLIA